MWTLWAFAAVGLGHEHGGMFGNSKDFVKLDQGKVYADPLYYILTDLYVFNNIPYTKPRIGEDRFKPPEEGVYPDFPKGGLQHKQMKACPSYFGKYSFNEIFDYDVDEDCLVLNVHSPDLSGNLPVMIWIHGGSWGYGAAMEYDLTNLAMEQNVVVVGINYRLAVLGYMATQESLDKYGTTGGMNGNLDQVEAMRWVKDNIHKFGGDPTKVTIFGESAGGLSICWHLFSEKSKGLFKRAMIMSGACYQSPWDFIPKERGIELANAAIGNMTLDDMRAMTAEEVQKLMVWPPGLTSPELEVVPSNDGYYLPEEYIAPQDIFENSDDLNVEGENLVLGVTTTDTLLHPNFHWEWPDVYPVKNWPELLTKTGMSMENAKDIAESLESYTEPYGMKEGLTVGLQRLDGFACLGCPAKHMAKASKLQGAHAYMVGWSSEFEDIVGDVTNMHGDPEGQTVHAAELFPLFWSFATIDGAFERKFREMWGTFAKKGGRGLTKMGWDTADKGHMYIDGDLTGFREYDIDTFDLCEPMLADGFDVMAQICHGDMITDYGEKAESAFAPCVTLDARWKGRYEKKKAKSVVHCFEKCMKSRDCVAWSYNEEQRKGCRLYSKAKKMVTGKKSEGFVAGTQDCHPYTGRV